MKKILYLQQNGLTAILSGTADAKISDLEKVVPVGLSYVIVDEEVLPSEEHLIYFRDALTADFDSPGQPDVRIDPDKAREIAKNIIRSYRDSRFQQNDIVIRDAMIADDSVTLRNAIKERDRLRALPDVVKDISDIDEMIETVKTIK